MRLRIKFALALAMALASPMLMRASSVALAWTASPTSGVTGYNIYRAQCATQAVFGFCGSLGAFAALNESPVTGTSYTDTTATANSAYVYFVTAVCPDCSPATESAPSNAVVALIFKVSTVAPGIKTGMTIRLITS